MANEARFQGDVAASRWRGATALVFVLAFHLALFGGLRSSDSRRMRHAPPAPPAFVTLRLLPRLEPAAPKAAADAKSPARPRSTFAPISARIPAPAPVRPQEAPSTTPAVTQAQAGAAPSPPASQASQPPPLNLALPKDDSRRAGPRNPALDDPRANTARTTPEQRMAAALDPREIVEDLGGGRKRIRRGDTCVIVKPARIGELMPFDAAAARATPIAGPCP